MKVAIFLLQAIFIEQKDPGSPQMDMLTNLPVYRRNAEGSCETNVIKELLQVQYYNPKGRPPYSTSVLRFALIMRYTSNSAYQYLKKILPLTSNSLLCKLKSQTIDTSKGLVY